MVFENISMASTACFDIISKFFFYRLFTGKSLSEALIFVSTNPHYVDRLFGELQVQYMKIPGSTCSAKRRASDKDLPV